MTNLQTGMTMAAHEAGGYTTLALRIDGAMSRDIGTLASDDCEITVYGYLKASYLATYGEEWSPLYSVKSTVSAQASVGTNAI